MERHFVVQIHEITKFIDSTIPKYISDMNDILNQLKKYNDKCKADFVSFTDNNEDKYIKSDYNIFLRVFYNDMLFDHNIYNNDYNDSFQAYVKSCNYLEILDKINTTEINNKLRNRISQLIADSEFWKDTFKGFDGI